MFLFSGRGYWQELIESILWSHNKLKVAPAIQPRALSITQGRAVGSTLLIRWYCNNVGILPCTYIAGLTTSFFFTPKVHTWGKQRLGGIGVYCCLLGYVAHTIYPSALLVSSPQLEEALRGIV
jgi:hypothetical protein